VVPNIVSICRHSHAGTRYVNGLDTSGTLGVCSVGRPAFVMTEPALNPLEERYRVQSVERALQLLETLAAAGPDGSALSELARSIGVSKSTAYAILQTMLGGGFVADVGARSTRRYRLGMALARLGDVVVSQITLRDVALPVLRDLARETGLTSRVAVLEEPYAVVIARVDAPNSSVRFAANLGKREHLHCSAVGKAMLAMLDRDAARSILDTAGMPGKTKHTITDEETLLAELETVSQRGYAVDDEEDADGVFCVGVAVNDHTGRCAGAISVTGIKRDLPSWQVALLGTKVREYAARISASLGAPA
jgi:IclR family acetate operon transcriptional repressor